MGQFFNRPTPAAGGGSNTVLASGQAPVVANGALEFSRAIIPANTLALNAGAIELFVDAGVLGSGTAEIWGFGVQVVPVISTVAATVQDFSTTGDPGLGFPANLSVLAMLRYAGGNMLLDFRTSDPITGTQIGGFGLDTGKNVDWTVANTVRVILYQNVAGVITAPSALLPTQNSPSQILSIR